MKYGYTILYVKSVKETIEFYEKAFGFHRRFISPEQDYGELATGDTIIAFASHKLGTSNFKSELNTSSSTETPFGIELAFVTTDIEAYFERAITMGAIEFEKISEKPWGQKVGYLRDNNGFLIEICTPIIASQ